MPKKNKTPLPEGTPDWIVISASRYALGRRSYIVGMTVDYLLSHWERLEKNTKTVILRDIDEYLGHIDNSKEKPDFCDDEWRKVVETARGIRTWINTYTWMENQEEANARQK